MLLRNANRLILRLKNAKSPVGLSGKDKNNSCLQDCFLLRLTQFVGWRGPSVVLSEEFVQRLEGGHLIGLSAAALGSGEGYVQGRAAMDPPNPAGRRRSAMKKRWFTKSTKKYLHTYMYKNPTLSYVKRTMPK